MNCLAVAPHARVASTVAGFVGDTAHTAARVARSQDPTLASFGHDPWWLIILKAVVIFVFLLLMTLFAIWAERRVIGRMQNRLGPNRAGPAGLLQSIAEVISYEIAMGLSWVAVFLYAGSLSTSQIVAAQAHGKPFHLGGVILHAPSWYAVLLPVSFGIYLVTMVGETNRLPFDLPEGEGEIVGGFHTEYSSLKFALFYLAEYINMTTLAALATTRFLGDWRAVWPLTVWSGANSGWWPMPSV